MKSQKLAVLVALLGMFVATPSFAGFILHPGDTVPNYCPIDGGDVVCSCVGETSGGSPSSEGDYLPPSSDGSSGGGEPSTPPSEGSGGDDGAGAGMSLPDSGSDEATTPPSECPKPPPRVKKTCEEMAFDRYQTCRENLHSPTFCRSKLTRSLRSCTGGF